MPSAITKRGKNVRSRRLSGQARPNAGAIPILISSVTKSTTLLTIVFNQSITLSGVPKYTTNLAGVTPVSVAMTGPTTIAITFSATIAAATTINIPYEEPAVRNSSGGYVYPSTFPAA